MLFCRDLNSCGGPVVPFELLFEIFLSAVAGHIHEIDLILRIRIIWNRHFPVPLPFGTIENAAVAFLSYRPSAYFFENTISSIAAPETGYKPNILPIPFRIKLILFSNKLTFGL